METKFTPGPWSVKPWSQQEAAVIAHIDGKDRHIGGFLLNADASLTAAAPDLYAAVEEMLGIWDMGSDPSYAAIDRWRNALDKARGE